MLSVSGAATLPEYASAADALEEVIVTAQRREQSMQDVPVAVTAFSEEALKVNRITDVYDLGSMVPNLTVTETAGGIGTANFAMRGIVAQGQVAGQDKSVGVYIDGVHNGAPWGSVFDMPAISRIEVLRGPQGTLFGRNSTAGAVSFFTPDPSGEFSFRQQLTVGNFDQFRSNTAVDFPAFGPVSAFVAYDHDERTGDLRNLGAGQIWDRTAGGAGVATSPKTLGDKNSDAVFIAVKLKPNDDFSAVYKFDYLENDFTPNGMALTSLDGSIVPNLVDASDVAIAGVHRPRSVNNSWIIPGYQEVQGHNLTVNWQVNDSLSLKSITGYRETFFLSSSQYDGYGGFTRGGQPFGLMSSVLEGVSDQWSQEIQSNYRSDLVTLTAGVVYYDVNATNSGPNGGRLLRSAPSFGTVPGGIFVPPTTAKYVDRQETNNKSTAAYLQTEWHVAPRLDLVAGYRWTEDDKSGTTYWTPSSPTPRVTRVATTPYKDAESTYTLGVNYEHVG
jgi:iron complex outermembrane receptor protein